MIVSAIIVLIVPFIMSFINFFIPSSYIPESLLTNFVTSIGYVWGLNSYIPVVAIGVVFGVFVLSETAYKLYEITYWIIKKIPTIS